MNCSDVCRCPEETSGPIWVLSSAGLPTVSLRVDATNNSTKRSNTDRSTNTRLRAQQSCPVLAKTLIGEELAACSRSQSAKTMLGDLPPSSSDTRLMSRDANSIMRAPTDVDPVNEIFRI